MKFNKNNNIVYILIISNFMLFIGLIALGIIFYKYQKRINVINNTIEIITEKITETAINTIIDNYLNKNNKNS